MATKWEQAMVMHTNRLGWIYTKLRTAEPKELPRLLVELDDVTAKLKHLAPAHAGQES